jgi:dienelactone hydrolase
MLAEYVALATQEKHAAADLSKIAVTGYCQTRRHPLVFAAEVPIGAAVAWYGAASKREWRRTGSSQGRSKHLAISMAILADDKCQTIIGQWNSARPCELRGEHCCQSV